MVPLVTRSVHQAWIGASTVPPKWTSTLVSRSLKRGLHTALFFPGLLALYLDALENALTEFGRTWSATSGHGQCLDGPFPPNHKQISR